MNNSHILFRFYSEKKIKLIFYVTLAVIHGFMVLPIPLILRFIIDHVAVSQWNNILLALGALLLISIIDNILSITSRFGIVREIKNSILLLQQELVRTIIASPHKNAWADYEDALKDVIVHDTFRLDLALTIGLSQVLPALISIIMLCIVLLVLSPTLFFICCGIFPACVGLLWYSRKKVSRLQDTFRRSMATFEERVGFMIGAWQLVKTQTAEQHEISAHKDIVADVRSSGEQLARQQTILQTSQEVIGVLFGVILLGFGFFLSSLGILSVSQVISFFVGFSLVRVQLATVFTGWPHVVAFHDALFRVEQILTITQETPYIGTDSHVIKGEISLQNFSLSFKDVSILEDVTATFRAGTLSVIEGKNGAGKTTLLLALLGLLVPKQGNVLIDGKPLTNLDITQYRKQVAVVSQDAIFLHANTKENESYGLDDQFPAELHSEDFFIDDARDVSLLSGGEKQRLMISRALKRHPKILFLDEATNHLDSLYRKKLFSHLQTLLPTTTIICITHDQDLINIADARYRITNKHLVSL